MAIWVRMPDANYGWAARSGGFMRRNQLRWIHLKMPIREGRDIHAVADIRDARCMAQQQAARLLLRGARRDLMDQHEQFA